MPAALDAEPAAQPAHRIAAAAESAPAPERRAAPARVGPGAAEPGLEPGPIREPAPAPASSRRGKKGSVGRRWTARRLCELRTPREDADEQFASLLLGRVCFGRFDGPVGCLSKG